MRKAYDQLSPEVICVIPARGGSKGIPLKNLQKIGTHSLIARSVLACLGAELTDRVIVSTDHDGIAAEARDYGAEVISRPQDLSGDTATSESAVRHALDTLGLLNSSRAIIVALVQATSPFTRSDDLNRAVRPILEGSADSVFTATLAHPYTWSEGADGLIHPANHDHGHRTPRQELAPTWVETGAVYATKLHLFRESNNRFNGRVKPAAIEPERALEIDSLEELEFARRMTWLH